MLAFLVKFMQQALLLNIWKGRKLYLHRFTLDIKVYAVNFWYCLTLRF